LQIIFQKFRNIAQKVNIATFKTHLQVVAKSAKICPIIVIREFLNLTPYFANADKWAEKYE
jgi:hypothetical protein